MSEHNNPFDASDVLDDPEVMEVTSSLRAQSEAHTMHEHEEEVDVASGEIPVESGVPIPEGQVRRRKYPLDQMEVGQSFAVTAGSAEELKKLRASIGAAVRNYRATMSRQGEDVRFVTKTTDSRTIRCWRIA